MAGVYLVFAKIRRRIKVCSAKETGDVGVRLPVLLEVGRGYLERGC
jgi:hypothetical protein